MSAGLNKKSTFRTHKSYSVKEILAAGGTTAFGKLKGQSNEKIVKALASVPPVEPFSEKEWEEAVRILAEKG